MGLNLIITQLLDEKVLKEHEYKKVLTDIKQLGTSLQEIKSVMMKEICSKSGSINSHFDFKRSILSNVEEKDRIDEPIQVIGNINIINNRLPRPNSNERFRERECSSRFCSE